VCVHAMIQQALNDICGSQVCVCERGGGRERVCACVKEGGGKERESLCVKEGERARERVRVCVS